eukprot:GGOE01048337.1.p1 GENE.GGOE01048337.1~~GGOE01048337.1.p1  ORF type:complete len:100 (+),score=3.01 GGOE01048337.1:166-465(+)
MEWGCEAGALPLTSLHKRRGATGTADQARGAHQAAFRRVGGAENAPNRPLGGNRRVMGGFADTPDKTGLAVRGTRGQQWSCKSGSDRSKLGIKHTAGKQ